MDGIDASLVKTDGLNLHRTGYQINSNYKKKTKTLLKILVFDFNKNRKNKLLFNTISELITKDHLYAINQIIKISGITPDLIGFHGQTIFHNPANKESLQIGNGKLLANLSKIKVRKQYDLESSGCSDNLWLTQYHQRCDMHSNKNFGVIG